MTSDSKDRGRVFKVHKSQGVVELIPHESGLHYLDMKNNEKVGIALVTTISKNFEGVVKKQMEGAIKACCFQTMLGHPLRKDSKSMIPANLNVNCPMTPENISCAHQLFGKKFAGMRGKTV